MFLVSVYCLDISFLSKAATSRLFIFQLCMKSTFLCNSCSLTNLTTTSPSVPTYSRTYQLCNFGQINVAKLHFPDCTHHICFLFSGPWVFLPGFKTKMNIVLIYFSVSLHSASTCSPEPRNCSGFLQKTHCSFKQQTYKYMSLLQYFNK